MDCFIGLDIGTSSVKGMLLSENAIVKTASREYPLYYPKTVGASKIRRTGMTAAFL